MSEISCNHCGRAFDEQHNFCPNCHTPTPAQKEKDFAELRKKFIYFFIGLVIFCAVMMLSLPRDVWIE